jgi:hypothetical protein
MATNDPLSHAVRYLLRNQHPTGSWTDFWLPVGTSDAWATAFVAISLLDAVQTQKLPSTLAKRASNAVIQAASWLLKHQRLNGGWGYNGSVPPDADSTAFAVTLLCRLGMGAPEDALRFLHLHREDARGYRTYRISNPDHLWTKASPDITASVLNALYDAGEFSQTELKEAWERMLHPLQEESGIWTGFWWRTHHYTTGLCLEAWEKAGYPPIRFPVSDSVPADCPFDLAWSIRADLCRWNAQPFYSSILQKQLHESLRALSEDQESDGGWKTAKILYVPPSQSDRTGRKPVLSEDSRRLFTTASVLSAFAKASRLSVLRTILIRGRKAPRRRSDIGVDADRLVHEAASQLGLTSKASKQAVKLFQRLTRGSLAAPCPYPSPQLSCLSGGMPLEFSVAVVEKSLPVLRLAAEIASPFHNVCERARSALKTVERIALWSGYQDSWERIRPAFPFLIPADDQLPDGLRFILWGGVDVTEETTILKVYFNLLHQEIGGGRDRMIKALACAGIPFTPEQAQAFDLLDTAGYPQEIGFGFGQKGKYGCKVYYELAGWRRDIADKLLSLTQLPGDAQRICPEIPGILRESLAAKSRSGISLRIDSVNGAIQEITSAAAFPYPLIPVEETQGRVATWIEEHGWDSSPYLALSALLLKGWRERQSGTIYLHSLFTRTATFTEDRAAIYLRPCLTK